MGCEYLIKNGRTKEECYLKSIGTEKVRDPLFEYEYGQNFGTRKKKGKKQKKQEEERPRGAAVAI